MRGRETFLLQKGVFTEDGLSDTESLVRRTVAPCLVETVPDQEVMAGSARLRGHRGPFRGSLVMAQRMGRKLEFTDARAWGATLRKYILSQDYYFLDAASVLDRFPADQRLFVRPASGFKEFSGNVFTREKFAEEFHYATQGKNIDPCTICMVSTPLENPPSHEGRLIFINHKLVGASQYMEEGQLRVSSHVPDEVVARGLEVARDSYFLNVPDFVLDFAAHEGGPRLVEVNAAETSSFYGADLEAIYRAWGEAVTAGEGEGYDQPSPTTGDLLEKAILLATKAHGGQVDKAGQPYILHALRVMLRSDSLDGKIAGVLHDVVEDTPVTLDDLRCEGFPENIIRAVDTLTKRDGESRFEAAARAVEDPLAREVKLADNADNMDLSRITNPTDKDYLRLEEYAKVRKILESVEVKLKSARDLATEHGGESLLTEEDQEKNHFIAGLRDTRTK